VPHEQKIVEKYNVHACYSSKGPPKSFGVRRFFLAVAFAFFASD